MKSLAYILVAVLCGNVLFAQGDPSFVQGATTTARTRQLHVAPDRDELPTYYMYHGQPYLLSLDKGTIAVKLRPGSSVEKITSTMAAHGLQVEDKKPLAITSWFFLTVSGLATSSAGVNSLLETALQSEDVEFASPVFHRSTNDWLIIKQDVVMQLTKSSSTGVHRMIDAASPALSITTTNFGGMPDAYVLTSTQRNGFEVLRSANRLALDGRVQWAEPDMMVSARHDHIPNDPFFGGAWGIRNTGQLGGTADLDMDGDLAWDFTFGSGAVKVLILDEGVQQDHPDINQLPGADFTGEGGGGGPVNSCDNHGTAVAGCISAIIDNSLGTVGIAPGCRIISARTYIDNCSGGGTSNVSWIVNALAWGLAQGARVSNHSWAWSVPSSAIEAAYASTYQNGMIHFAAAGNESLGSVDWPASAPYVNSVAALDPNGALASFSNSGPGLDFSAPGVSVATTDRTGSDGYANGDYVSADGTSFASPYAAGVAALIVSEFPGYTSAQVETRMQNACFDLGVAGYDIQYGWGFVNAYNGVEQPASAVLLDPTGGVGTNLRIDGDRFSSTPSENVVYFGGVRGVVTFSQNDFLDVTIPSGALYAPVTVTKFGVTVSSPQVFLPGFMGSPLIDSLTCASKLDINSGFIDPRYCCLGDLNGDGKNELVVADGAGNRVAILQNTSTMGNLAFAPATYVPMGGYALYPALGDLDGDGRLDLIVSRQTDNTIRVARNTSTLGAISFAVGVDYLVSGLTGQVAVADFNLDGKPDIAIANGSKISILKNNSSVGDLWFSDSPTVVATGTSFYALAAADMDGDRKCDLVFTEAGTTVVSVKRNLTTPFDYTFSFGSRVDNATNVDPLNLALGDIDGDGRLDIAVANQTSNNISLYHNEGSMSFAPKVDVVAGEGFGCAFGDLNGDGRVDLVVAIDNTSKIKVFRNTASPGVIGQNSFAAGVDFTTGSGPYGISVGDIDGDGKPDIACTNGDPNTVSVLRNIVAPASIPVVTSVMPDSGLVGTNVTISGSGFSASPAGNLVLFGGVRAAVSSASSTGLVAAVPPGASYGRVFVSTGGNVAVSAKPFNLVFPGGGQPQFLAPLAVPVGSNPLSVAAGDFNGDGKVDLAAENYGDNTVSILIGDGTGDFAPGSTLSVGSQPYEIATADFTGEGVLDLVVTNSGSNTVSLLRGTGAGTFLPAVHYAAGTNPYGVGIGDFNRDGRLDLAVSDNFADSISILLGTGSGGFLAPVRYAAGNSPYGIAVSDFNNDGKADLAVVNYSSNDVSIFLGSGSGTFSAPVNYTVGGVPFRAVAGDWNADGAVDLAVSNFAGGDVSVLLGTGAGAFSPAVQYPVVGAAQGIACADLNGDGRLDLVVAGYGSDSLSVLAGTGTGVFAPARKFPAGADPVGMTISDLNNDGRADLVVTDQAAASVAVLLNTVASSPAISVRGGWNILSVPVRVADARRSAVFPTATSAAYRFNPSAGYQQRDTLGYGEGYWIKFDSVAQIGISGAPRVADTFHVAQGWNMVGSLTSPVPVASVQPLGTGILSAWYAYDSGYQPRDTLLPGRGYWVKVSQSGGLAVGIPAAALPAELKTIGSEEEPVVAHLSVTDAGGNKEELVIIPAGSDPARLERYELPPVPPEGAFDVRFASGHGAAEIQNDVRTEYPVTLSSPMYPVRIDWAGADAPVPVRLVVDGRQYNVAGTGGVTLQAPAHAIALIANPQLEVPATYALMQNYPNPFNPATTLRYGLPEQTHVRLRIYSLLGEEVKTLVDEVQEPGFKSVEWNSSDNLGRTVASGVYFYRLEAGSFVESKRMILLK
jgi:subtilisin family serine protease